jgi:predicted enzyme related to lactoylglutathione lyase
MSKMDPVVHFEMSYEDKDRVTDFYHKAFGWEQQQLGPDMGDYIVAETTERDDQTKLPKEPGRINGGFYKRTTDIQYPSVVIAVENLQESMKKVEDAGGKIIGAQKPGQPDDIPGIGLYISFFDSEGNRVGMLQPSPRM